MPQKNQHEQLTQLASWRQLEMHAREMRSMNLQVLRQSEPNRDKRFLCHAPNLTLSYPDQKISEETRACLIDLAHDCQLPTKIAALMGQETDIRLPYIALHTALRTAQLHPILVDGEDILPSISATRQHMYSIADAVRNQQYLGYTHQAITDVVNIGIGGSYLGPYFCMQALQDYVTPNLRFHYMIDFDDKAFNHITRRLRPETTLFIVASKSFTTPETLYNAQKAKHWFNQPKHMDQHFIAVTAHPERARAQGFNTTLPIWEWVGGRFSTCSAINLITCIGIGSRLFSDFLAGASELDQHFLQAPLEYNLPVLLGLIGIWNNNFQAIHQHLLLTYAHALASLPAHVQQLDMESNGKSLNLWGQPLDYATGPIIWGGDANQAQHSYFQLLCQGTHKITADLISIDAPEYDTLSELCRRHNHMLVNGIYNTAIPEGHVHGNIPTNHVRIHTLSPRSLGSLLALYEHKVFTQGTIWNINSFNQPGVEHSKRLFASALPTLETHHV